MFDKLIDELETISNDIISLIGIPTEVKIEKDNSHYRLNVVFDKSKTYYMSITGRGVVKERYYSELFDIFRRETAFLNK